jgi:hypothetical protein
MIKKEIKMMIDDASVEEIYANYYREFSTYEQKFPCTDLAIGNMFFAICYLIRSFDGDHELSKKVIEETFKKSVVWHKELLASQEKDKENGYD